MRTQLAEYDIIRYRPAYRSQLLELQTHMWSQDFARNERYLDWKFYTNPYYDTEPIIHLALHRRQLVGMRAMFWTRWQGGQPTELMRGVSCADAVVHPAHRRRGLLQAMTNMMLVDLSKSGDYAYDVTLSANRLSAALNLKCGWRSAGSLGWVVRQPPPGDVSPWRQVARKLPIVPSVLRWLRSRGRTQIASQSPSPDKQFAALDRTAAAGGTSAGSRISVGRAPRPKEMAALVERTATDGRIRHVRDEQFYAWRFQNPLSEYRFLFYEEERLEGYLVLQMPAVPRGDNWVTFVDWEATRRQIWDDLVRAAMRSVAPNGLAIWSATLQDEAKTLLHKSGFREYVERDDQTAAGFEHSLLVRRTGFEQPNTEWTLGGRCLLDVGDWDLRPIYSDSY